MYEYFKNVFQAKILRHKKVLAGELAGEQRITSLC
jgi:dGTP triphosphohydrolase